MIEETLKVLRELGFVNGNLGVYRGKIVKFLGDAYANGGFCYIGVEDLGGVPVEEIETGPTSESKIMSVVQELLAGDPVIPALVARLEEAATAAALLSPLYERRRNQLLLLKQAEFYDMQAAAITEKSFPKTPEGHREYTEMLAYADEKKLLAKELRDMSRAMDREDKSVNNMALEDMDKAVHNNLENHD